MTMPGMSRMSSASPSRDVEMRARNQRVGGGGGSSERRPVPGLPGVYFADDYGQAMQTAAKSSAQFHSGNINDMLSHPAVGWSKSMAGIDGLAGNEISRITGETEGRLAQKGITRDSTGTWRLGQNQEQPKVTGASLSTQAAKSPLTGPAATTPAATPSGQGVWGSIASGVKSALSGMPTAPATVTPLSGDVIGGGIRAAVQSALDSARATQQPAPQSTAAQSPNRPATQGPLPGVTPAAPTQTAPAQLPVIQSPTRLPGSAVSGTDASGNPVPAPASTVTPGTQVSKVGVGTVPGLGGTPPTGLPSSAPATTSAAPTGTIPVGDGSLQLGNAQGASWDNLAPYEATIQAEAAKWGVDPRIIRAAAMMESQGIANPDQSNAPRSSGIMQIEQQWHSESAAQLGYDLNTPEGQIGYFAALISGNAPGQNIRGNTPLERYINNYQGPEAGQTDPAYTAAYQSDVETLIAMQGGEPLGTTPIAGGPVTGQDPATQQVPGKVAPSGAAPQINTQFSGSLAAATNCFGCAENPGTFQPEFIVYHMTDGESFNGVGSFDQDGDGVPDGSTNYIIDKDGTIYELVPPGSAMPWANGQTEGAEVIQKPLLREAAMADNLNNRSISIEMVGISGQPLTPEQIASGQALTGSLSGQYGIPMDDQHLVGHNDITPGTRSDPLGSYDPMDMVPVVDPTTGQQSIDPASGQPIAVDTATGQPVLVGTTNQTGQPVQIGTTQPPGKVNTAAAAGVQNPVGMQIADIADDYIGSPYVLGGNQPGGWDCSGFVYFVAQKAGMTDVPMGSHEQYNWAAQNGKLNTDPNSINSLQPGDLIFFDTGFSSRGGNNASHVAIYLGDGKIIDAANPNDGTRIIDLQVYLGMYPYLGSARL